MGCHQALYIHIWNTQSLCGIQTVTCTQLLSSKVACHSVIRILKLLRVAKALAGQRETSIVVALSPWAKKEGERAAMERFGISRNTKTAFVDVHTAKWTAREISLCSREIVRLAIVRLTVTPARYYIRDKVGQISIFCTRAIPCWSTNRELAWRCWTQRSVLWKRNGHKNGYYSK